MILKAALIWFVVSIIIAVVAGKLVSRSKVVQGLVLVGMILVAVVLMLRHLEPFSLTLFIGFCLVVTVSVYRTTIVSRFGDREDE